VPTEDEAGAARTAAAQNLDIRTTDDDKSAGIDFLDFLFTFVLGFGLLPEALGIEGVVGPLTEGWFTGAHDWSTDDLEKMAALVLGLLTLTLSWFGYHASVQVRPIDYTKISGLFRFQLDVLLVLLYGLMLLHYRSFGFVAGATVAIFLVFVVWDWFRARELGEPYMRPRGRTGAPRPYYRRELVTVVWMVLIVAVTALYAVGRIPFLAWSLTAIAISVLYRIHKIRHWEWLEKRLGAETWEPPRRSTSQAPTPPPPT
jgi:hypothetical protein